MVSQNAIPSKQHLGGSLPYSSNQKIAPQNKIHTSLLSRTTRGGNALKRIKKSRDNDKDSSQDINQKTQMAKKESEIMIPNEIVKDKIYLIRDKKVMLDRDLAQLYNVETKVLKQAVRRNIDRFPGDFMFELSNEEFTILRSQIVTSSWGGARYISMAFTEQGVAMLSSVLNSKQAIHVNIQIMRVFTQIRERYTDTLSLKLDIEKIKKKLENQDRNIELVFSYLDELMEKKENPEQIVRVGFKRKDER